jgi:hypothetical protein
MKTPVTTVVKRLPDRKHLVQAARSETQRLITPVALLLIAWMIMSCLSH